ncbi:GGDEF domain-containing protein [Larsenimonas salina]|uniref:GGDEF domain-containing protein n=1 Tax=Larsenimonas salina TaxID=1295565 RepID=UPI0020737D13|nr:GGDEF domain-containing protein [Larsenimonas salina]MCM5703988.1 GGDEF domain-containing protein [Larsenimonas salina]
MTSSLISILFRRWTELAQLVAALLIVGAFGQEPILSNGLLCFGGLLYLALGRPFFRARLRLSRALNVGYLALIVPILACYVMPTSWVNQEQWHSLFDRVSFGHLTYYDQPALIGLLAIILLAFYRSGGRFARLCAPMIIVMAVTLLTLQFYLQANDTLHEVRPLPLPLLAGLLLIALSKIDPRLLRRRYHPYRPTLTALILGAFVMSTSLVYWHYQNVQMQYRLNSDSRTISNDVLEQLDQALESHDQSMEHLNRIWNMLDQAPTQAQWQAIVSIYFDTFTFEKALAFVSPSGVIERYQSRGAAHEDVIGKPLSAVAPPLDAHEPDFSPTTSSDTQIVLLDGQVPSLMYYFSSHSQNGHVIGATVSILSIPALLDSLNDYLSEHRVALSVILKGDTLYSRAPSEKISDLRYCNMLAIGDSGLTLCTAPTQRWLADEHGNLADIVLVTGLIFALMTFALVRLNRQINDQRHKAQKAKARLEQEIEQRKLLQYQVEWLAHHDELTGLANRRHFIHQVQNHPSRAIAVAMIDIDHFKAINDRLGHHQGDRFLKGIASALSSSVSRYQGSLARYGGEEFIALFAQHELCPGALEKTIRAAVDATGLIHPLTQRPVTVSLGVALGFQEDIEQLIIRADEALYRAKQQGRDQLVIAKE